MTWLAFFVWLTGIIVAGAVSMGITITVERVLDRRHEREVNARIEMKRIERGAHHE